MAKIVIHERIDGSVWYEGLAPKSPIPAGKLVLDHSEVSGKKPEYMRIVAGQFVEDATLKSAYLARDRRSNIEKLIDLMEADGILTKAKADQIRGR